MITRREFGRLALSATALPHVIRAARLDPTVGGVRIGVQTYSFRDLPRTAEGDAIGPIIAAMRECGLEECELFAPHVEPRIASRGGGSSADSPEAKKAREELRRWRLDTPLDHFRRVRQRFADAGISVYAFNYSFNGSMTDDEIDRGFDMARALGADIITASTTLPVARRAVPFAEKHKMVVAMHNHSNLTDPDEFATPASFAAAMQMSKYYKINLDIGHFTAANFDAVAFIGQHHASITNLHLKDRKRNQGDTTPWGQGDAPIRQVLQLLKREKWPIRGYIEYEYPGSSPVAEVKKCLEYCRQSLT